MVDEKTVQEVVQQEQQPADPQRRKLLKVLGASAGVVAIGGGAYLLGRSGNENEAPVTTVPAESPATTQPNLGTTSPAPSTTTPETTPTTQPETTTIPGETLAIPLESLPTSIDNPQEWADKIYALLDSVFNDTRWDLFGYVYNGGLEGPFGEVYAPDITTVESFRKSYPEEFFQFDASVVEDRTRTGQRIISIDETRSFMENSTRRIVDYGLLPKTVRVDINGQSQEVELYLINSVDVACEYDENGVCS
jgi:hypothetical protein